MEKIALPKGTRDFGPEQMAKRQFIIDSIKKVFQKYGFQPLETPAMENLSTLTGKYGEEGDQLLFKILNSGDFLKDASQPNLEARNSKLLTPDISEKGLRYDLTVPFARYVVMNRHEIVFPFRRYQIQPVWRADRPQKGRYREFYQCDADVVGTDSLVCEAEIILMIKDSFKSLGINDYTIKINHRDILSGLAEMIGATGNESSLFVAIDKLDKIGEEKVKEELKARGFNESSLPVLFETLNFQGNIQQKVEWLSKKMTSSEKGKKGLNDLTTVFSLLQTFGSTDEHVELDLALARGLSYYTGCIFEVKINHVAIGSVSGGGRYDNLTAVFDAKEKSSGVGFSFGIDRLYDALEELNAFPKNTTTSTTVLITHLDEGSFPFALKIGQAFREKEICCEIYPDRLKIKKQMEYADRKKIPFVVVVGPEEVQSGLLTVKNMETGNQSKLSLDEVVAMILDFNSKIFKHK
ncbi:MAG: histidine--tRNA ligase [Bacteroidetes bacterium]|nr:histidine--tRNA ligase [Bacteroidota bacterium]